MREHDKWLDDLRAKNEAHLARLNQLVIEVEAELRKIDLIIQLRLENAAMHERIVVLRAGNDQLHAELEELERQHKDV